MLTTMTVTAPLADPTRTRADHELAGVPAATTPVTRVPRLRRWWRALMASLREGTAPIGRDVLAHDHRGRPSRPLISYHDSARYRGLF